MQLPRLQTAHISVQLLGLALMDAGRSVSEIRYASFIAGKASTAAIRAELIAEKPTIRCRDVLHNNHQLRGKRPLKLVSTPIPNTALNHVVVWTDDPGTLLFPSSEPVPPLWTYYEKKPGRWLGNPRIVWWKDETFGFIPDYSVQRHTPDPDAWRSAWDAQAQRVEKALAGLPERLASAISLHAMPPCKPEWAKVLMKERPYNFITPLDCFGDCLAAIKVDLKADYWQHVLGEFLYAGKITL